MHRVSILTAPRAIEGDGLRRVRLWGFGQRHVDIFVFFYRWWRWWWCESAGNVLFDFTRSMGDYCFFLWDSLMI